MAVYLTRVLIRPLSIPGLTAAFNEVIKRVNLKAQPLYNFTCPYCKELTVTEYILWQGPAQQQHSRPISVKVACPKCKVGALHPLSAEEEYAQRHTFQIQPQSWFPTTTIHWVSRKPPVPTHRQLFTDRNSYVLAEIFAAIEEIDSLPYREALKYVFTASLYNCSQMQMFSEKEPSSSRGWTALRYYIPQLRKEMNVLRAFTSRFETFLSCKRELNNRLPSVRITQNYQTFKDGEADLLVKEMPWNESIKIFGATVDRVFLDPPYHIDVDYFGFSEFWGAWLKMDFDFAAEWHARKVRGLKTTELLTHVAHTTPYNTKVGLALDPIDSHEWGTDAAIANSGYHITSTGYFLYDHSNKLGGDLLRSRDKYYILERLKSPPAMLCMTEQLLSNSETYPYLRAKKYILADSDITSERLRALTSAELLPLGFQKLCDELTKKDIEEQTGDPIQNRNTYRSLYLALVNTLLQKDDWCLAWAKKGEFEPEVFGLPKPRGRMTAKGVSATAMFVSRDRKRKLFFFFPDQGQAELRASAETICRNDGDQYNNIAIMLLPSRSEMEKWRPAAKADRWPRAFFMAFDELRDRCRQICPEEYTRICCPVSIKSLSDGNKANIAAFTSQIINNVPVGGADSGYYKLRFQTSGLTGIVPGQFIMMDTTHRNPTDGVHAVPWKEFKTSFPSAPQTYLKRPFGVHRAFYKGFDLNYLQRLNLPTSLAAVMHTVLPDTFDVFYKALLHGKGTNEMKNLQEGESIEMLGPLGNSFDFRKMLHGGVKEVHVIGGGVGMAPLIFLVQALRFLNVSVKAFIGIENTSLLHYKEIDEAYSADSEDAIIYFDDLTQAGVAPKDIFISYDKNSDAGNLVPTGNHGQGFVSTLYESYISKHPTKEGVVAFACGPTPMMKALYDITRHSKVNLYVLMEKRMACGIGVCLSCVCETTSGKSGYSRVCKEGPIFNAGEIVWE
jgi:dihydroorotate dehydrogenase electron transfer subunit